MIYLKIGSSTILNQELILSASVYLIFQKRHDRDKTFLRMDGSLEQPLCCCEYINSRGERAHLFGLFCDCTEVDDFVDRVVKGLPVPNTRNEEILATLEDRYSV